MTWRFPLLGVKSITTPELDINKRVALLVPVLFLVLINLVNEPPTRIN